MIIWCYQPLQAFLQPSRTKYVMVNHLRIDCSTLDEVRDGLCDRFDSGANYSLACPARGRMQTIVHGRRKALFYDRCLLFLNSG